MNVELTKTTLLQQQASDPLNSAWVFASAGSGKTKVLTDRVLRLLLENVRPDKILCLTFTKTAAAEMLERINNRLASWVMMNDEELLLEIEKIHGKKVGKDELKKARILFAKILDMDTQIKVQTIHSFCQNLVKIFPFENNVRPNFEVMDANMEKLLLQKAKKEVFALSKSDESLKNSIIKINARLSDEGFNDLIGKVLAQKEKLIFLKEGLFNIENIIEEIFKKFAVNKNSDENIIFAEFLEKISVQPLLDMAIELENDKLKTNQKTAWAIKKFLQNPKVENFSDFKNIFFTKDAEPKKPESIATKAFAQYHELLLEQKILIAQFSDKINSYKIANSCALLLRFIDKILQKYADLKASAAYLDYNDLIIKTDKMLKDPNHSDWIKFRMDSFFDHILVDESQDTNHRQWSIIKALSEDFFAGLSAQNKNRTIFIIGDDKQSIYSFQGAQPNISHEIFSYYKEKLEGGPFELQKIDLQNSFRSTKEILQAVDEVFVDSSHMGSVEYQAHSAIRDGKGKVEIWPQIKAKKTAADDSFDWQIGALKEEKYQEKEFLAEYIALKIKDWVENKRKIAGSLTQTQYGNIMILLRNRANNFDKVLQKFFQKYEIPYKGAKKTKFSEELLIKDLLACASFALLPEDDLNLACLLKSPLIGLSEDDLFKICVVKNEKEISLYKALQLEESSFPQILEKLNEIILKSKNLNCFEFFTSLLDFEIRKKIISEFGAQALEILDQFMIIVMNFCQNNLPILQKFIDYANKLDPQITLDSTHDDQVTIATIHSAKGLQAKIVMVPDCSFNFNQSMVTKENFFWINFGDIELPIWCPRKSEENYLLKQYKILANKAAKQEYFRLLYVAMTRAEDELYIGGFGAAKDEQSWLEIIKNSLQKRSVEFDFLENMTESQRIFFEKKVENFIIDDKILCFEGR